MPCHSLHSGLYWVENCVCIPEDLRVSYYNQILFFFPCPMHQLLDTCNKLYEWALNNVQCSYCIQEGTFSGACQTCASMVSKHSTQVGFEEFTKVDERSTPFRRNAIESSEC